MKLRLPRSGKNKITINGQTQPVKKAYKHLYDFSFISMDLGLTGQLSTIDWLFPMGVFLHWHLSWPDPIIYFIIVVNGRLQGKLSTLVITSEKVSYFDRRLFNKSDILWLWKQSTKLANTKNKQGVSHFLVIFFIVYVSGALINF